MIEHADKGRSDREFVVGDLVYVKLQLYWQKSIVNRSCLKLFGKYFGTFAIVARVGVVAYKLQLPQGAKVHTVFHISQLKKHVEATSAQSHLLLLDADGTLAKEPMAIINRRINKRKGRVVTEVLVHWSNYFSEDATWECLYDLQQRFPSFNP